MRSCFSLPAGKFAPFFLLVFFLAGNLGANLPLFKTGKFAPVFILATATCVDILATATYVDILATATYVDYLMFSHLNTITNPTPLPNATLTIGATARNPNYCGVP